MTLRNAGCVSAGVVLRSSRAFLILAACFACAVKLRTGAAYQPTIATQEVNRCLSVVRAAARRNSPVCAAGRRADTPVADLRPAPSWPIVPVM
jgi:hypothetical protein